MDRRAFLSLRSRGRLRVLDLSCERLYMRWVDARGREARTSGDPGSSMIHDGEPPTRVAAETVEELLEDLDRRLNEVDVLRMDGVEWLREDELRRHVETSARAFEGRGGRVERGVRTALLALLFGIIGVLPSAAQAPPDDALRSRVEAALAAASDLPADSISVQVHNGVVTLSGSVLCEDEACGGNATPGGAGTVQQSLGAVVRAIPGVTSLRFALRYRPPASG